MTRSATATMSWDASSADRSTASPPPRPTMNWAGRHRLGTFNTTYVNQTSRVQSVGYPNGHSTSYDYFPNSGDRRLQQILNQKTTREHLGSYAAEMPRAPQPQTGRVNEITVNHGSLVYVTDAERRRADFVLNKSLWIALTCCAALGIVKVHWKQGMESNHRKDRDH